MAFGIFSNKKRQPNQDDEIGKSNKKLSAAKNRNGEC